MYTKNFSPHSIIIEVYFHLVPKKDPYIDAFKATGCPNKKPNTTWPNTTTQSDKKVLNQMNSFCELTRDGNANDWQRKQCCGAKDCNVAKCMKQSAIINGKKITKDSYEYNK